MRWVDRADDLLFDGETIETQVAVGDGGVVVTTHRVLAFTPDRDGPNYRTVDRPNVEGVDHTTSGDWAFLEQGLKALVAGIVLIVAGRLISLDSLVGGISLDSAGASGQLGLGGMMGLLGSMLTLLAQLDDLMQLFGGLALAFAAVVLGVYAWSRESLLVFSVAGEDDIELTAPEEDHALDQLRTALFPGEGPPDPDRERVPEDSPA
ncbi:hypothetical protein [Haloarcula halophila]|uniref:hypothetical protein n=1 Tax=Haloarcula TaxID=2237 RepID=UPI0023E391C8|nr:hypothetical protein [Halomicroarcula sp. DFY41]